MGFMDKFKTLIEWPEPAKPIEAEFFDEESIEEVVTLEFDPYAYTKVAGVSNYQKTVQSIFGEGPYPTPAPITVAVLEFEPTNKFDKKAIKVTIEGALVGYIPREDQADVAPQVRRINKQGFEAVAAIRPNGGGPDKMTGLVLLF